MSVDEARRVLRELQASFTRQLTDEQTAVWASTLDRLHFPDALAAVRTLRLHQDTFPTHNQFWQAAKAEARQRAANVHSRQLTLGDDTPSPEEARVLAQRGLAASREALAAAAARRAAERDRLAAEEAC